MTGRHEQAQGPLRQGAVVIVCHAPLPDHGEGIIQETAGLGGLLHQGICAGEEDAHGPLAPVAREDSGGPERVDVAGRDHPVSRQDIDCIRRRPG